MNTKILISMFLDSNNGHAEHIVQFMNTALLQVVYSYVCISQSRIVLNTALITLIPEPTARSAVPGVSPGRGLLISYYRSSKSLPVVVR